jgi:hypothetical protein
VVTLLARHTARSDPLAGCFNCLLEHRMMEELEFFTSI